MAKRNSDTGTSRSGSKSKSRQPTDAIQMLEADHRKVETLFKEFLETESGRQEELAQDIFRELEVHSALEEQVFYPALRQRESSGTLTSEELDSTDDVDSSIDDEENDMDEREAEGMEIGSEETGDESLEDTITSAYDDHRMVREQITRLRQMGASTPEFRQGMVELQEMVADHVSLEEDELFTEAKISVDTKALGRQMQERRADILSEAA